MSRKSSWHHNFFNFSREPCCIANIGQILNEDPVTAPIEHGFMEYSVSELFYASMPCE